MRSSVLPTLLSWIFVMQNKVGDVDYFFEFIKLGGFMLVGMLKSLIMMWLSQRVADRSWNSSRNKEGYVKSLRLWWVNCAGFTVMMVYNDGL